MRHVCWAGVYGLVDARLLCHAILLGKCFLSKAHSAPKQTVALTAKRKKKIQKCDFLHKIAKIPIKNEYFSKIIAFSNKTP